jgi:hypothetical protein
MNVMSPGGQPFNPKLKCSARLDVEEKRQFVYTSYVKQKGLMPKRFIPRMGVRIPRSSA